MVKIIGVNQFREPGLNFNRNDMYHTAFNYLNATEDKDIASIGFMSFFDHVPELYEYAVLYASVSAFEQFKDLDFNAVRNRLRLEVRRSVNAVEFTITNTAMASQGN
ncbi:MAG: hypothetical protein IKP64_05625 [Selenomonadaceae bacterium]|nr:hypothetical protein [Selenomonadaceae bacterium]MBR4383020.1 hypothetical protein [Selenomonadaceae bacterium]